MKIKHFLRFYADTKQVKNAKFSFKINNYQDIRKTIDRFTAKGFNIKAAYYVKSTNGLSHTGIRVK